MVAAPVTVRLPFTESFAHGEVVPIPTFELLVITKADEDALSASLDVPIANLPSIFESNQCFKFVPASESVIARYGVDDATCSDQFGVVDPIPTFPAKYAFPVVVAPPEIVRPPACNPFPIVEEA
jgi:hypothetical protein